MQPNITTEMANLVRIFMKAFDQPVYPSVTFTPCEVVTLRSALITEEAREYSSSPRGSEDELDAICDLLYVTLGTNITMSIPVEPYSQRFFLKKNGKPYIWNQVLSVTQDLDCKFPCEKIQRRELAGLTILLIDIADSYGYDLRSAFATVHASNMSKLWTSCPANTDGLLAIPKGPLWLVKRLDGKVVKPATFVKPDLSKFLPPPPQC